MPRPGGRATYMFEATKRRRLVPGIFATMLALGVVAAVQAQTPLDFNTNGADKPLDRMLRGVSLTVQTQQSKGATAQDIYAAARADYARIVQALYSEGYYGPTVSILLNGREVADIAPLDVPDTVRTLSISVIAGPLFHFRSARMRPYAPGTAIPRDYADEKVARSTAITDAAQAGVDGWRALGYAKARVAGEKIVADHPARMLDSLILLQSGQKLRFGHLHLAGYSRVRAEKLARIAGFPTGKTFDPKSVDTVVNRVLRTGAFKSATLTEADRPNADGTLDITLTVAEEKRHRIGYGAEIESRDGFSLNTYWIDRNVFGGAERLRIDLGAKGLGSQTGGRDLSFGARFDRPATFHPDVTGFAQVTGANLHETDYREKKLSMGIGATQVLSKRLSGQVEVSYTVSDVTDAFGTTRFEILSLPITATYDTRNSTLDAVEGKYVRGEVKPFLGFASAGSGVRTFADARLYRGLGSEDRVVLAGRLQAGSIFGPGLLATPRDDLFYSGGGGTVRGQPYQSLGVNVLRSGALRTGGMSFLGVSTEVRVHATDKIGVVGFFDAGLVTSGSAFGGISGWQSGAGFGLRYDTGFGPVRLDLAVPVGGNTGNGLQVYVGIGQAF